MTAPSPAVLVTLAGKVIDPIAGDLTADAAACKKCGRTLLVALDGDPHVVEIAVKLILHECPTEPPGDPTCLS